MDTAPHAKRDGYPFPQWVTTRKVPHPQRLPAQYRIVTLNVSECMNSMIEEYRSENHKTQRISDKRQECIRERGNKMVPKVKAILRDSFHKAGPMEVVALIWGNQYMVTEKKGSTLNINLNANRQTTEMEQLQMKKVRWVNNWN